MEEEETNKNIPFRDLIETNIIIEFEIQDGLIHEQETMYFKPKILIKDMIEKVVNNFNTIFKEKNKNIYLRPEGINFLNHLITNYMSAKIMK